MYVINVLHHLASVEEQRRAFAELVRVLRPGGVLFVHEINTRNVLFRFYMGYVFPSLNCIDEGVERWLLPHRMAVYTDVPVVDIRYFTFLPDFLPRRLVRLLTPIERLARSLAARGLLGALHGGAAQTDMSTAAGPATRLSWRHVVTLVAAVEGVAIAAWLVPASVHIVSWPESGPERVALFAPLTRLRWLVAIGVILALALAVVSRKAGLTRAARRDGRTAVPAVAVGRAVTCPGCQIACRCCWCSRVRSAGSLPAWLLRAPCRLVRA